MQRSGPPSSQAEAEMENWEVKDVNNWTASPYFKGGCLYSSHYSPYYI